MAVAHGRAPKIQVPVRPRPDFCVASQSVMASVDPIRAGPSPFPLSIDFDDMNESVRLSTLERAVLLGVPMQHFLSRPGPPGLGKENTALRNSFVTNDSSGGYVFESRAYTRAKPGQVVPMTEQHRR
jgi:hypothetical protein